MNWLRNLFAKSPTPRQLGVPAEIMPRELALGCCDFAKIHRDQMCDLVVQERGSITNENRSACLREAIALHQFFILTYCHNICEMTADALNAYARGLIEACYEVAGYDKYADIRFALDAAELDQTVGRYLAGDRTQSGLSTDRLQDLYRVLSFEEHMRDTMDEAVVVSFARIMWSLGSDLSHTMEINTIIPAWNRHVKIVMAMRGALNAIFENVFPGRVKLNSAE